MTCCFRYLASKVDPSDLSRLTPSPLHIAVYKNYPPVVQVLLALGADVNGYDETLDATPLALARQKNDKRVIKLLLAAGAMSN